MAMKVVRVTSADDKHESIASAIRFLIIRAILSGKVSAECIADSIDAEVEDVIFIRACFELLMSRLDMLIDVDY